MPIITICLPVYNNIRKQVLIKAKQYYLNTLLYNNKYNNEFRLGQICLVTTYAFGSSFYAYDERGCLCFVVKPPSINMCKSDC